MPSRLHFKPAFFVPSFAPLRVSICAVLGLSAAACGGNVTLETSDGGSAGAGGTGGDASSGCEGAVPIMQANAEYSGFDKCADGTVVHAQAVGCYVNVPACQGNEINILCKSDADCADAPNGRCAHIDTSDFAGPTTVCGCAYPCNSDAECGAGKMCVCAGVVPSDVAWPTCAPAACATNASCASGECSVSSYNNGCGHDIEAACRTANDVCRVDGDCQSGFQCVTANVSGVWSCETTNCAIGRPLIVEGQARTAPRSARSDWSDLSLASAPRLASQATADAKVLPPETASLSPGIRAALAATWREVAELEHASIGSFARFSLELLALGAPPALLLGAQQAAADEVIHAQLAYALAGTFAGEPLGPAALDVRGIAPAMHAAQIAASLVAEACVGETIGAAEARALAGFVKDPAVAAVYERIADDEARHAELGWSTLAWLLRTSGDDMRKTVADAFEKAMSAMQAEPRLPSRVVSPEHGLLSPAMHRALRRQALTEVVAPCARTVLGVHVAQNTVASA